VFAAASSQVGDVNPLLGLIAGLLVSGGVHAVKSLAVRPVVNATTAGLGNVPVSIGEQATSTVVSILSVLIPVLVAIFLVFVIALILWWSKRRKKRQKEVDFD